ncbi:MAG: AbrB/MazE/SpoVT family DNA-binding protein [Sphingomonas bacterium]|jgi:antitoxin VapB|uniref:AbrB/MazE/SpoVT family DNA-binding domain-containing protein n=1 Tax=Sphingomonas bacterium TaxID=1895847 RepID=UPI00260D8318|nr:AbrB/MazE/SpoVT family DNA-binding domain-containing protein [Sphingomonas bacterium]MDB5704587.1 AbrB/MazE/SpoVT family DNA-binding protein [Sphingomonas bacterium]
MTEYRAKIFKSGNSLALRLPKALGLKEGAEMRVRDDGGKFTFEPADVKRKIDVSKFWGKAPGLAVPPREDFDDPPRVWDAPGWPDYRKHE